MSKMSASQRTLLAKSVMPESRAELDDVHRLRRNCKRRMSSIVKKFPDMADKLLLQECDYVQLEANASDGDERKRIMKLSADSAEMRELDEREGDINSEIDRRIDDMVCPLLNDGKSIDDIIEMVRNGDVKPVGCHDNQTVVVSHDGDDVNNDDGNGASDAHDGNGAASAVSNMGSEGDDVSARFPKYVSVRHGRTIVSDSRIGRSISFGNFKSFIATINVRHHNE